MIKVRWIAQGFILGPLLFNIFLDDILFFINNTYLCKYADNNTIYTLGKNLDELKLNFQSKFSILQKQFYENHTILVTTCHYIILEGHSKNDYINLNGIEIESSRNEALFAVALDNGLKFDAHIKSL